MVKNDKCRIIAEIGLNHDGSLEKAGRLVIAAKASGCDYAKFQMYSANRRYPTKDDGINDLLRSCELDINEFKALIDICATHKIKFLTTVFDKEDIDSVVLLGIREIKISSFDATNFELIDYGMSKNLRFIISLGLCDESVVNGLIKKFSNYNLSTVLLHCISAYPTPLSELNLNTIPWLHNKIKDTPKLEIGFSDHSVGTVGSIAARSMGLSVIEKHFRLNGDETCVDRPVSLDENQMTQLVDSIRDVEAALGAPVRVRPSIEDGCKKFRRVW